MVFPPKKKRRVVATSDDIADATSGDGSSMDVDGAGSAKETATSETDSSSVARSIACKDVLTKELIEELDRLESSENGSLEASSAHTNVSIALLKLKSLQRGLLNKVRETQETLRKQALVRNQQELQLENLRYQQTIHARAQKRSDSASEKASTEIAKLVRHHTKGVPASSDNATNDVGNNNSNNNTTPQLVLNDFLGDNWQDPSRRSAIVSRLNQEVATRKELEEQRDKLGEDRKSKQDALNSRQKILKDLPAKVAEIERASLPLQKFFQKLGGTVPHGNGKGSPLVKVAPKLGTTKRRNRLDLAKTLPKALYTLFHQLQSCLDVLETTNATTNDSSTPREALPTIDIESNKSNSIAASHAKTDRSLGTIVVLKIPIPTVSAGGELGYKYKKQATVSFEYDATADLVLASCGNDYDMGQVVIDELFPGDGGEYLVSVAKTASRSNQIGGGRAYQWCNYLAGLRVAPAEQSAAKMHLSARVIVGALVRRVRATATLSWILHSLSQKPQTLRDFPVHAALRQTSDENDDRETTVKLSSWTALENTQSLSHHDNKNSNNDSNINNNTESRTARRHLRVYSAVLQRASIAGTNSSSKKTGTAAAAATTTLTAQVTINAARYPSVIPRWKIAMSSSSSSSRGSPSLADEPSLETLRDPERLPLFNEDLARLEKDVNRNVDRLVVSSDQSTYDWILGQQLVEIARGWGD